MKIAVLGTGNVGQTIGAKLASLNHEVIMGSRSADNEKAKNFAQQHSAKNGTFAEAAAQAEIIFNCVSGGASMQALQLAGTENLKGKILVDLSNPLDFSTGTLRLSVCNDDSLGEQIQRAFPETKVVKTLNTLWCGLMFNPHLIGEGNHQLFMCGNDSGAKTEVMTLLQTFGWNPLNIMDLGDITGARGMEMYLPLWLRIYGVRKNGTFNMRIIEQG